MFIPWNILLSCQPPKNTSQKYIWILPLARQRQDKDTDKDKSTRTHAIFEYLSFKTIEGEQKTNTKIYKYTNICLYKRQIQKYTNLQIYTNIQIYVQ